MKIKVPGKSKKVNAISVGTVNPVHTIPAAGTEDGVEEIDLSVLKGWDDLSIQKQRYLVEFSKSKMKKKRAALAIGMDTYDITVWLDEDGVFRKIYNDIIDLHVEGVEEVDYLKSYTSNTSRGRFLKHRSKQYKETEENKDPSVPRIGTQNNQTNIFAVLNDPDVQKDGLAGVRKVFNSLKEQGQLPDGLTKDENK